MKTLIGVIGGSSANVEALRIAYEVGKEIAKREYILINGGKGGVMEASAKGAKALGGITIGLLPGDSIDEANKYIDIAIPTGLGHLRNGIVSRAAQGVIVINGGAGTMSEIAFAWIYNKPIVAMKNSGGWAEKVASTRIDEKRPDKIYAAETAQEALDWIENELNSSINNKKKL